MRENRRNKVISGYLGALNGSVAGLGIVTVVHKYSIDVQMNPQFLDEGGESR
jgi:hypothetical protein